MIFILKGIDSVRTRSANISPGGFISILQLDHGLDEFANKLEAYQLDIGSATQHERAREFKDEFNILWGNLDHFNLRLLEIRSAENLLLTFKHDATQFLNKTDTWIQTDLLLDSAQVSTVLDELATLQLQLHEIGQNYFHSSLDYRETWITNLGQLYKILLFFSAILVTTACLLVAILIRSNNRKNTLISEADEARAALSSTVEELRSGRMEQRAKDSFIAAASHDLRQPLHALGLFLGSLEAHIVDEKGRSTLNEAIQCSTNLGSLFDSLLDLSRLDAGIVKVEYEHFRLKNLLDMLQNEYQAKTLNLATQIQMHAPDVVVKSDPILLSRIIRNLIENALIHSNADTITVRCSKKTNHIQLEVHDNGVGISQAEQQQVFTEYYQINNRATGAGKGLGLGLSIVKRLTDLLDMRIRLHSEVGVSTTFTMDISAGDERLITAESRPLIQTAPSPIESNGRTIAVVDDDEKICMAMDTMLKNIGLNVVTASTADALIDNLIESELMPSLIVADYRLQRGQTGDQAIVQLRRALNIDVPGLLITGDTAPHRVAEAAKSGFELLHKPVQPAELFNTIRRLLAKPAEKTETTDDEPVLTLVQ